jgi:hypothetical protein
MNASNAWERGKQLPSQFAARVRTSVRKWRRSSWIELQQLAFWSLLFLSLTTVVGFTAYLRSHSTHTDYSARMAREQGVMLARVTELEAKLTDNSRIHTEKALLMARVIELEVEVNTGIYIVAFCAFCLLRAWIIHLSTARCSVTAIIQ